MRRRSLILTMTSLCVAFIAGAAATIAWQRIRAVAREREVLTGCQSDHLHPLAGSLARFAETHSGRLPPADTVLNLCRTDSERRCFAAASAYSVNARIGALALDSQSEHALVWCPVGAHGDLAAVVLLRNGRIEALTLSLEQLARVLETELK